MRLICAQYLSKKLLPCVDPTLRALFVCFLCSFSAAGTCGVAKVKKPRQRTFSARMSRPRCTFRLLRSPDLATGAVVSIAAVTFTTCECARSWVVLGLAGAGLHVGRQAGQPVGNTYFSHKKIERARAATFDVRLSFLVWLVRGDHVLVRLCTNLATRSGVCHSLPQSDWKAPHHDLQWRCGQLCALSRQC